MQNLAGQGLRLHRYQRNNQCLYQQLGACEPLVLMRIEAGAFWMGAGEDEAESQENERPRHQVTIREPFLMGRYPVTQAQWREVAQYPQVKGTLEPNPSHFQGENRPVEQVSWNDATEFCLRLSAKTGRSYRLPSEAEWEYACRAETQTPFHYGEQITAEVANYWSESSYNDSPTEQPRRETTDVGSFPSNRWGLCDLHGNVWEWCQDHWHSNYQGAPSDGSAWLDENDNLSRQLLRGGSWDGDPRYCRSACRRNGTRDYRDGYVGFRVCCELPRILSP